MLFRRFIRPVLLAGIGLFTLGIGVSGTLPTTEGDRGRDAWADSVLQQLSMKDRVAQLFMIAGYSNKDIKHETLIDSLVRYWKPGGLIVFQGTPAKSSRLVAQWQSLSNVPMLVSMDAEWGPSMRLDSLPVFPRQMTLGAVRNDSLIRLMGREVGRQLGLLGVHLNFAPVVDVNNNPANPVINSRAFGENPARVAARGLAYSQGLRDAGILSCAKHFPGHGDTEKDSHVTLPVVNASRTAIDSIHLPPFKALIENQVDLIMTAHIHVPALDKRNNRAATLSNAVNAKLLRDELGFRGVVITDALNMKGVSDYFPAGEALVEALKAGVDILLMPQDLGFSVNYIVDAINKGKLDSNAITSSCRRILLAKFDAGLNQKPAYQPDSEVTAKINSQYSRELIEQLYRSSIVLVRNDDGMLPLKNSGGIAVVNIGGKTGEEFVNQISLSVNHKSFSLAPDPVDTGKALLSELDSFKTVVINLYAANFLAARNYGVSASAMQFINLAASKKNVILNIAGSPYLLSNLSGNNNLRAIIVSHEDRKEASRAAAQAISGLIRINGQLPVSAGGTFREGFGLTLESSDLSIRSPFNLGIPEEWTRRIDSIALQGIVDNAYPGCQILLAKNGEVFYHKAFGTLNNLDQFPNNLLTLYDIASVTKVAASSLAIMKLYEEKKLDIDQTLGYYLPELKGSNKEKLVIREVLAHQARLKPWIPVFRETIPISSSSYYQSVPSDSFAVQVSEGLFLRNDFRDTLYERIMDSELESKKRYLYSDLGYYFMQRIVEKLSGQAIDTYLKDNFYDPMGLANLGYHPLNRFPIDRIAPTENDTEFRGCVVRGYVHDQGAALLGGIAGHAGIFSNAWDLAAIMQLILNEGEYGGKRYLKESTIREFTKQQFPLDGNRRALIFDRPNPQGGGQVADEASQSSFGHSGFTGTFVWADPSNGLVFIFLSNRVYPDAGNQTINRLDTRRMIQSQAYQALSSGKNAVIPE